MNTILFHIDLVHIRAHCFIVNHFNWQLVAEHAWQLDESVHFISFFDFLFELIIKRFPSLLKEWITGKKTSEYGHRH